MQPWISVDEEWVAIQVAMRANWDDDQWTPIKEKRRKRRGDTEQPEKLYLLSNRDRKHAKSINGCWLFGPKHIQDLGEQVKKDFEKDYGDF